jgi:FKBP-type peptidyl-prolyl cis-trans isomerase
VRLPLALMATATALAVTLTGCTAPAPAPEATAGASSDLIEVTGEFGEAPRVDFPTPLSPGSTQCTELVQGDGERLIDGQQALIGLAVYNGTTGEEIQAPQGFGDEQGLPTLVGASDVVGLNKALTCASEGSRTVAVLPADDAFGEEGNPQFGIEPDDSIVLVFDVKRAFLPRAIGTPQLTRDGFPAVVLAPDGRPGITVPDEDPFESTEVELLKQGHGEEVESGDQVVVHYTGVSWEEGTVLDGSTWAQGGPTAIVVGDDAAAQGSPSFAGSLEGVTVGSQVGIAVPADEAGNPAAFYVVDVLGVV